MSTFKRLVSLCLCLAMLGAFLLIPVQSASNFAGIKGPTLVKQNGIWYYVKDGAVCKDTTLVKYSGSWYYVKNGTTQPNLTTLVKYNGEWWYVVNGKVASNTTTLVKYNNEWWYVVKGKIAGQTTNLIKYNGEWFYVVKGKVASQTTTLVKYNGSWYYIYKGKLASKTTTLFKYNGSWYYVKNGTVQTSTSGEVTVNGNTYFVKNGVLTNCHTAGHYMLNSVCTRCGYVQSTQVTLDVWVPYEDMQEDGWVFQMIRQFEESHPEYDILWHVSDCPEYDTAGRVTQDPQAAADVYLFHNDQIGTLADANAIAPLTGSYAQQVQTDNSQTTVGTVTGTDGNIYGFPISSNTWFMYYNKDVFSEKDVKSLNTMLEKGKVAFPWTSSWYSGSFFFANGCTAFGPNGIDASDGLRFGDVQGEQAALAMIDLVNHPNMYNDVNGFGCDGFQNGEVDAYFSGSWDYANLKEALGDKLGVAVLPTVEINGQQKQLKAFAGSKAVGVNPNAENKTVAMEFAAFLASPESQKARYEECGVIPAAKAMVTDTLIKQNPAAVTEINTMTYASVVQPSIPKMAMYWTPMGNFGAGLVNGEITRYNYKDFVAMLEEEMNNPGL